MPLAANRSRNRLLVVSYFHPPFPAAGGNRWLAMSHYLQELGYSVTVIACNAWGILPNDAELSVMRVGDLRSVGVLRRLLRRGELAVAEGPEVLERPAGALLTKVVVPDLHALSWLPAVVVKVRRMLDHGEIDCLVTSSPPPSAHLLGLLLGRQRPPWVADFRDGWKDGREPFPTAAQRRLDTWLEARVAREADAVVGATAPIAADLTERLDVPATCVLNGWDPRLENEILPAAALFDKPETITLVHTGTLVGRPLEPLLSALAVLRDENPEPPLRIVLAGPLTTEQRDLISTSGVADLVEQLGTTDRGRSLGLQRSADALLLLTSRNPSEATSKIFEYFAARRPIIALAKGNEAARLVQETKAGLTVPPEDVTAIAAALRRAANGDLARAFAPRGLERFTYPGPAEAMGEIVQAAIARRSETKPGT